MKAVRVDGIEPPQKRLVGVAIDVTERVKQFRALAESEARFRTTADSAPAFIWMTDPQGILTFLNRHFAAFLGADATGATLPELTHAEDVGEAQRVIGDCGQAQCSILAAGATETRRRRLALVSFRGARAASTNRAS